MGRAPACPDRRSQAPGSFPSPPQLWRAVQGDLRPPGVLGRTPRRPSRRETRSIAHRPLTLRPSTQEARAAVVPRRTGHGGRGQSSRSTSASYSSQSSLGRRSPNVSKKAGISDGLLASRLRVDAQQRSRSRVGDVEARRCRGSAVGSAADRRCRTASALPSRRSTIHLSTRLFSPKPGQMNLPSSSLRNQLTKKMLRQLAPVLRCADLQPVARSSRPCCSRRTAASRTGRGAARRPCSRPRRCLSEATFDAEEHAVLPSRTLR